MRVLGFLMLVMAMAGCKSTGNDATVKGTEPGTADVGVQGGTQEAVGLDILDNRPAVTQIDQNVQPDSDWGFSSGNEYWLYSSRGRYMTFSSSQTYAPYQNRAACDGQTEDPESACSVKPSNVAQACQYIASLTLKALMENPPEEYTYLRETYGGSFNPFGWMNDGHSDAQYATALWQEPFIWRGDADGVQIGGPCPDDFTRVSGYLKWVSSVDKNGVCKTPSKGQFLALLKKARTCLEQNAGNN